MAGEWMAGEMAEQPRVIGDLIDARAGMIEQIREVLPSEPAGVILVARGSSDNAAVWGRYVLEVAAGRPVSLAAPSLLTTYHVQGDYHGYVAVAISQSGETPEIVESLTTLQDLGTVGIALTNRLNSPLGKVAHLALPLKAGSERAVPATKTFTATLACLGFLAEAMGDAPWRVDDWDRIPTAIAQVLDDPYPVERVASEIAHVARLICVARGYLYPVALEMALKIKETTSIPAQGYSSADFHHGPIATMHPDVPMLGLFADGPTEADIVELAGRHEAQGAQAILIGSGDGARIPVPNDTPEPLAALTSTVRAQQLALFLALARGLDPDRPSGLSKVTRT